MCEAVFFEQSHPQGGDRLNLFTFYTRIYPAPRQPPVFNYFSRPFARTLADKLRGMLGKNATSNPYAARLHRHRCFSASLPHLFVITA